MSEHERNIAIREAEHIAASDAYFDARHRSIDTLLSRSAFEGGFCRAWDVLSARVAELDSKAFAVGQVLGRAGFKPEDMSNPAKCIEAIMQNAEKFMAERDAARAALAKREADDAEHVAWLRYDDHNGMRPTTLHLCDSDAPGAFKVFRTAKREAVAGGVVWQARHRGCSEWSDVGAEHAERLRICSRLVRAVVVVSPESDTPVNQRELYAAPPQPAEEELKCDQCGKVCNNPWHGSTETNRHTHACDECHLSSANTYKAVCAHYPQAFLLGLTATPSRLDGKGLGVQWGGLFDDILIAAKMTELRSAAVEYFNATIAETVRHEVKIVSTNRESFDRIEAAAKRLQEILDRTSKSKEVPHDRPV